MKIPFVDLRKQYLNLKDEINKSINEVIKNTAFIGGRGNKYVNEFEEKFSNYLGLRNVISCANGTDSLEIILKAYGIGHGDEVIVPAMTWISTAEAVNSCGAKPIFVDIEKDYYCIDISKIEAKITDKTKAIIPVHLYGQPAEMNIIIEIAKRNKLIVIEDCAQSHGAKYKGKLTGTIGNAGSFSFYPGKNLGAYGDAGCIVTNDNDLAEKCRMIANHGQKGKHNHLITGRNSRMDGIQAAILSVKLKYLEEWTEKREEAAKKYTELLEDSNIIIPKTRADCRHAYHLYVIQIDNRNEIIQRLKENNIETAIHYPKGLPYLNCYREYKNDINYIVVRKIQDKILSLPMYPELNKKQVRKICMVINHNCKK